MKSSQMIRMSTSMQADQVHHVGRDPMGQCNHEEADTRVLVDLLHALQTSSLGLVHTGGTDVIVILLNYFHHMKAVNVAAEILICFKAAETTRMISLNTISSVHSMDKTAHLILR
jgi:hypothetical protein